MYKPCLDKARLGEIRGFDPSAWLKMGIRIVFRVLLIKVSADDSLNRGSIEESPYPDLVQIMPQTSDEFFSGGYLLVI